MDYNLRILQSRVKHLTKQFSVMMVIGLVIQCLPCLVLCARFILLAPSPPNTKKMLWLFTWRIINKSMVVVGYRQVSKGGWPFSIAGHGWPISDCTAEELKGVIAIHNTLVGQALIPANNTSLLLSWPLWAPNSGILGQCLVMLS